MKHPAGARRMGAFSASLVSHAALLVLLALIFAAPRLDTLDTPAMRASLKYVNVAGIGGGGGGSSHPVANPSPAPPQPVAQPVETPSAPAPIALSLVASTLPPDIPGSIAGLSAPIALAPGTPGGSGAPGAGAGDGDGPGKGRGRGGNEGGDVYGPGDGVTVPVLIYERPPTYTPAAMQKRIQGTVELEAIVMADGTIAKPRVVRSLDPGLDQRALEAVMFWRFKPGVRRDTKQPVNVIVSIHLAFILR
jgi:protein TonB